MNFLDLVFSVLVAVIATLCVGIFVGMTILLFMYSPMLCIAALALIVVFTVMDIACVRKG
jgi:hypothetical protein